MASVESSDDVEGPVLKGQRGVEVPLGVQIGHLSPRIGGHIVDFALVHAFLRQRGTNCKDLRLALLNQNGGQGVGSPLEQHVSPLHESLLHKLIASLGSLARLSTSSEEDPALFVLDGHEVGWDLDVNHVRSVGVGPEVVHKQVVRIVDEEVKSVQHFLVVAYERHLQVLVDYLLQLLLGFVFLVDELDLSLLLGLLEEEVGVSNDLIGLLLYLLDVRNLGQELGVVLLVVLNAFLGEELLAHISPLVKFLGPQLHVDEVGLFQNLVHFVHLLPL